MNEFGFMTNRNTQIDFYETSATDHRPRHFKVFQKHPRALDVLLSLGCTG